jgi:DNA-binding IclR family transcriptional regulator
MTLDSSEIVALVMRRQGDFLERPALRLTVRDAERRFGADRETCEAVLGTLVNAGVLARSDDGGYVRFWPGLAHAA